MSKSSYLTKVVDSTFENDFDDKCRCAQQRNAQKQIMHDIELGYSLCCYDSLYGRL